ncbi:hypothetical protein [Oceanobacillus sp. CF4.6]
MSKKIDELEKKILEMEKEIMGLHHNFFALAEKVNKLEQNNKQEYFG